MSTQNEATSTRPEGTMRISADIKKEKGWALKAALAARGKTIRDWMDQKVDEELARERREQLTVER